MEGDCETAVGAHATVVKDNITLEAELFSLDGRKRFYLKSSNKLHYAHFAGKELGEKLKKRSKYACSSPHKISTTRLKGFLILRVK